MSEQNMKRASCRRLVSWGVVMLVLSSTAGPLCAEGPKLLHGKAAVEALGPRLETLAKRHGYGRKEELEKVFLTDSTLHVDVSGPEPVLLYIDVAPDLGGAPPASGVQGGGFRLEESK